MIGRKMVGAIICLTIRVFCWVDDDVTGMENEIGKLLWWGERGKCKTNLFVKYINEPHGITDINRN